MSKYTADEVERVALCDVDDGWTFERASDMLNEFARRLRQEETENRRDPVTDPRQGDRIEWPDGQCWVYNPKQPHLWPRWNPEKQGATIIRRREVQ